MQLYLRVFSDTNHSKNCTLRGLMAWGYLLVLNIVYLYLIWNTLKNIIPGIKNKQNQMKYFVGYSLGLLLIACALAVINPKKECQDSDGDVPTSRAVAYGLLVGFVVYTVINSFLFVLLPKWTGLIAIRNVGFGIVSVCLASLFTYYSANSANLYN